MQYFPFLTYLLFFIGLLIYVFTLLLINGKLFNLYSNNDYPYEDSLQFWKDMTSFQRLVLTETYYRFYIYFKQNLEEIIKAKSNKKIIINIDYLNSNYVDNYSKYLNVPFILVSLIPTGVNTFSKKLLICSHFDGHNLTDGGTAYDDAIHVASMFGTIKALAQNDLKINTQVDFLFDGGEEYGLIGAKQYVEYLNLNNKTENYDYLNLESMGGGPPYGFVIKNDEGNYRIQKALSKTRGSILLASNYIYATKFTSSITDHQVFDKMKWRGGVSVFLGKGSVYHSKYDKIDKEEHLKIAGNQLLDFVLNYEKDGFEGNSVGYGIAPICIVFPMLVMYILIPIVFIVSAIVIIFKEKAEIKVFLFDLLKQFACFLIILAIFVIESLFIYLFNSNSASANQIFLGLVAYSGLGFFLLFQRLFKIRKWSRFRLVLDSLLMMLLITTDLSLPFSCLTILSILFYAFDNKIVKFIVGILQVLVMSLLFAFLIQIFMQYTTRFSEIIGNLFVFIMFFIFSYHLSVSPLEFHEFEEKVDVVKSLNSLLLSMRETKIQEYLNESGENINSSFGEGNSSTNSSNKYFKKKYFPNYLIIFNLFYFVVLFLVLFLKFEPYSKDYTVRGIFLNVFKNKQSSNMIFATYNGYNYAKKNLEKSKFKNYKEDDLNKYMNNGYNGKCLVVESNDTSIGFYNNKCNITMPELDFSEIIKQENNTDGTFNFTFTFNIPNTTCIDMIYIKLHCQDCIKKINGINYDKESMGSFDMLLRVGKEEILDEDLPNFEISGEFTLNTDNFNFTIDLNAMKNTKEYIEFMDSFGEASCNTKGLKITDTFFEYDGCYPIDKNNKYT